MLLVILLKRKLKVSTKLDQVTCVQEPSRDQLLAQESAAHAFQISMYSKLLINFVIRKMHGTIAKDTHDDAVHV